MTFQLRDKKVGEKIIQSLKKMDLDIQIMHVCGTHQDTLVRFGLGHLFEQCGIRIIQGPGCPVCVTTPREIEECLLLAQQGKAIATFGDMIRVPGETGSLKSLREQGYDIKIVYGIHDAVKLAEKKETVFMAIGFETTAPATASVLLEEPPETFAILNCHRYVPPVLHHLIKMGEVKIDGLIEPGHVSTIIGTGPYEFLSRDYNIPQVITGFEPLDVLMGVWMLARQIKEGVARVDNEYTRAVHSDGNPRALTVIHTVFGEGDIQWRGFPCIPKSSMVLKEEFDTYNARKKYEDILKPLSQKEFKEPAGCRCGDVLRGLLLSRDCPLFGTTCTPGTPIGPCMVSIEGSCNIEYRYRKND